VRTGDGQASGPDAAVDDAPADDDMGATASTQDGTPVGTGTDANPCVSNGSTLNHHTDGTCDQASAFGSCRNTTLEVDCLCPNGGAGFCVCMKNGEDIKKVSYDCTACEAVGSSWIACGFPAL
jgi:hypothetical protein